VPASTYPAGSPAISVQALLKQPQRIARDLANLMFQRLVAWQIMVHGTPDQIRGGAMQFQQAENIFVDAGQDVEEISPRGDWPRAIWTEALKTAAAKQFGLELPVDALAIRRNQLDRIVRGERKLANNLVRFVDTQAIALLTDTTQGISSQASAAAWSINTTDIINEIVKAQETIENKNLGYNGFENAVMVLHTTQRKSLLNNTVIRNALPRERFGADTQIETGVLLPILGLQKILFTSNITASQVLILDSTMAATIAIEEPDPSEGWVTYDAGDNTPPIYVQVYDEKRPKGKVVSAGTWPGFAFTDPGAVVLITGC
jgi:hypothetical protein